MFWICSEKFKEEVVTILLKLKGNFIFVGEILNKFRKNLLSS